MEWRLEYDYEQLRALGVSTDEISQAVGLHYQKEFLGTYDVEQAASGKEWIRLVLMPEHDNREFDAGQIQVKVKDGRIIRLDELVKVVRMEEQPQSYYRINGLNSIYLSVVAEEAANQPGTEQKVQACMDDIRLSLPAGYEIHTSYDTTEFIHDEFEQDLFAYGSDGGYPALVCTADYFQPQISVFDCHQSDREYGNSRYLLLCLRTGNAVIFFGGYHGFTEPGD